MSEIVLTIGNQPVTVAQLAIAAGGAAILLLLLVLIAVWRGSAARARSESEARERGREIETQVAALAKVQGELTGRMQTMAEVFGTRQSELAGGLSDRLDKMSQRMGHSMVESTQRTQEALAKVHERLAVIDNAQTHIKSLSGQVVQLQQILSNKQSRGAFGQGRMEAIIQDGLPKGTYAFQATLSNNRRPDCLVHLPNDAAALVIDAKFPLEAWTALREAASDEALKAARQRFRQDVQRHIQDIRERYFIPGETQDTAFMFVPSESVFAEIHEQFEDLVQKAHRARVVIVSPSLLMLSIQVIQAVLRDANMQEQAHVIQKEVRHLLDDLARLNDRVGNLQRHFQQASKDIEQIATSSDKVQKRGRRITDLEFEDTPEVEAPQTPRLVKGE